MKVNTLQIQFNNHLQNKSFSANSFLLAISGGIDSMVLLDLFRNSTVKFQVAHCNFQLRGEDAVGDEQFVKEYCQHNKIPFYTIRFDVEAYQKTGNYSVEMACRNLRYNWFDELMDKNELDYLVTAHHLDDNVETFLINLSRGTGLKGLTGMQLFNGKIFRPLLEFTKDDLLSYAKENNINWREDYTNKTDDYTRNKIRHHILPVLKEIHPLFNDNFLKTLSYLNDNNMIIQDRIIEIKNKLFIGNNPSKILIKDLLVLHPLETYLYYLFEKYGFNSTKELIKFLDSKVGSEIKSEGYRLVKDRDYILLQPIEPITENEIPILGDFIKINSLNLKFEKSKSQNDKATEIIDYESISFPLKLRKVIDGDYFYPIGMKGQKKLISKFMKDLKLSKLEKEQVWLLCDKEDKIIWIVNYRLDERFKITKTSKNFLNITVC